MGVDPLISHMHLESTLMRRSNFITFCFALALLSSNTSGLKAGQIVNFTPHAGINSVAATPVVLPIAPNNDNVSGPAPSPNQFIVDQKNYIAVAPVDITFDVTNTGATTEYAFKEGVQNNTGLPWALYHIELGFNFGALFTHSPAGDGLDFDAPSFDSPTDFSAGGFITHLDTEDDIFAFGGIMPSPSFAGFFHFNIDVPDGITQFTLRQTPVPLGVPEPCAGVLVAVGIGGLLMLRKRRQR
jgi:hypothetical protein